ncbi:Uncharacterised protein [Mycobacteroides abscessus subsp. abscessus]|nr:Uncharacterised protein [Mycobacteroides abscessus subsp. abscessus]
MASEWRTGSADGVHSYAVDTYSRTAAIPDPTSLVQKSLVMGTRSVAMVHSNTRGVKSARKAGDPHSVPTPQVDIIKDGYRREPANTIEVLGLDGDWLALPMIPPDTRQRCPPRHDDRGATLQRRNCRQDCL